MFRQNRAHQIYRQTATRSASPGHIVLMLYDGTIRFLEQAKAGFSLDDPKEFNETINNNIQRAQAILNEMDGSLDMERGGEFSARMRGLYNYFDQRLQDSNLTKTDQGITEVLKHVTLLRDSWAEMLQTSPSGGALPPGDPAPATAAPPVMP